MNSLIRFYLHIDPRQLTDDEFAQTWSELQYAINYHRKNVIGLTEKV
jgi:hypothetical protein